MRRTKLKLSFSDVPHLRPEEKSVVTFCRLSITMTYNCSVCGTVNGTVECDVQRWADPDCDFKHKVEESHLFCGYDSMANGSQYISADLSNDTKQDTGEALPVVFISMQHCSSSDEALSHKNER